MSNLTLHRAPGNDSQAIALPEPRIPGGINIRPANLHSADYMFIDALQKKHSKMVGFIHKAAIEANIRNNHVLIAEEGHGPWAMGSGQEGEGVSRSAQSAQPTAHSPAKRVGYIIFHDKYLKREELGIVYQLNVIPGSQRGLVGASLLKAAFERSAYGCKLYCCWCAQDLEANYFWESMGFVPIAFRAGSRPRVRKDGTMSKPGRIHIFWQRRIRAEENQANTGETPVPLTPYWFPSETHNGAMREARIVLPIPPDTHWSDAKPSVLPGCDPASAEEGPPELAPLPLQPQPRKKREHKAKTSSLPGGRRRLPSVDCGLRPCRPRRRN